MESKKINQLATEMSPAISDLTIIGDPITGVSKKITLLQIADLFQTTGTVTSVAVTESGNALSITGSPITTAGTINIGFAGSANQYVRGDGALAPFPTSSGGGSSVSYYLNGSVNQGTFGGSTYYQMSKDAVIGVGTNFSTSSNGLIAQFITDANDPDVVQIPSGNWNIEFFMNVSASSGSLASFYVEIYKYNGSTFTLLATNSATPEELTNTTTVDAYYTSVAMPTSALSVTDRLAIRIYANVASKTVTLYTEDNRLCQVVTTFSKGMSSLNNLTDQSQFLATGTSGTDFAIVSTGDTHTFNLPVASATNTGKLSSTDWSTFNGKVPYTGATANVDLGINSILAFGFSAEGSGAVSGSISLKQNGSLFAGSGYATIGSTAVNKLNLYFGDASLRSVILDNSLLSANRTYNFPDLSGTLTLLEGNQEFSGYKTFIGGAQFTGIAGTYTDYGIAFTKGSTPTPFTSGTTNLYSDATTNNIVIRDTSSNAKLVFNNSTQTYTFPAASGTIALTSNLSSYVPYNGATANVDLGVRALLAQNIVVGQTSTQGYIHFKTGGSTAISADTCQAPYGTNGMIYSFDQTGGNYKQFVIDSSSLTNNTIRTYSMPDITGTLALLEGFQTFTGVKTFDEGLSLKSGAYPTPATGYSSIGGNPFGITVITKQSSTIYTSDFGFPTANRTFIFPNADGTIALTSDLGAYLPLTGGTLTGALSGTSATFSAEVTSSGSQGRFGGWATGAGYQGNALEAGVSGGIATILGYNRTSGAYIPMLIGGNTNQTTTIGGNTIVLQNNGVTALTIASTGAATFSSSVNIGGDLALTPTDSAIAFSSGAGRFFTGGAERMRITSGGNVGIGTSSPSTFSGNTTLAINNAAGGAVLELQSNGTSAFRMATSSSDSALWEPRNVPVLFATNNTERMRINSGGAVNIAGLAGAGTRTVVVDANGWLNVSSDSSLKQEDVNYKIQGLTEILQLQPKAYKWLSDIENRGEEATTEIGFFANEVASIVPSAAPMGNDGIYGFNDRAIITALVKGMQEQQSQIEELKALIAAK